MEEFRSVLQHRIGLGALYCGMMIFVVILFSPASADDRYGMAAMGAVLLTGAVVLARITAFSLALKKDEELKKLYIRETDERSAVIREKSGETAWKTAAAVLALAALAAGYLNRIVFLTLLGADLFLVLTGIALRWYYRKKY